MKSQVVSLALLAALSVLSQGLAGGQEFLNGGMLASVGDGLPSAIASPDGGSFEDGLRAVNQSRWNDAIAIFTKLAEQESGSPDGALYWMAYAENKLGRSSQALNTCTSLLRDYPQSS